MAASERTYTIPLRAGVMKTKKYKRAKKAVSIIKEFIIRHSKSSDVKIGKYLNLKLWEHGIRNVPGSVKVDAVKDDKGTVKVELFGAPKEVKKEEGKKGKEKKAAAKKASEEIKEAIVTSETPAEKKEAAEGEKSSVAATATATDAAAELVKQQ